jgi:hypothetical protein
MGGSFLRSGFDGAEDLEFVAIMGIRTGWIVREGSKCGSRVRRTARAEVPAAHREESLGSLAGDELRPTRSRRMRGVAETPWTPIEIATVASVALATSCIHGA